MIYYIWLCSLQNSQYPFIVSEETDMLFSKSFDNFMIKDHRVLDTVVEIISY